MSHFSVLVIGNNIEEQLAPYSGLLEVEKYKQGIVSETDKEDFIEAYTTVDPERKYGCQNNSLAVINQKKTFDELYKEYGEDWNSNSWEKDESGEWVIYSTYNPKAKWDSWEIGGRWFGAMKLKEPFDPKWQILSPAWTWNGEEREIERKRKVGYTNSALIENIDFGYQDLHKYNEAIMGWELWVEGRKPRNGEEEEVKKEQRHGISYHLKRFKTKENYEKYCSTFTTFAVLRDEKWYQKGEIGWFGALSSSIEDGIRWARNTFFS